MKKYLFLLPLMLMACQQADEVATTGTAHITFNVAGFAPITRTALAESDMTDLWLFDFVGDNEVQAVHLTDFNAPSLDMTYGTHRVCLVAARGDEPTINETTRTITWNVPRDTFWGAVELNVGATNNNSSVSVTLDRVATRLRILITDEVPSGIVSVSATPSEWYYALNYEEGTAAGELMKERVVNVPSNYVGTSGTLAINFFGISDSGEWMTDVLVKAIGSNNAVIGQATINNAPFVRNRVTDYSGPLFGSSSGWSINLNDEWDESYTGTW